MLNPNLTADPNPNLNLTTFFVEYTTRVRGITVN